VSSNFSAVFCDWACSQRPDQKICIQDSKNHINRIPPMQVCEEMCRRCRKTASNPNHWMWIWRKKWENIQVKIPKHSCNEDHWIQQDKAEIKISKKLKELVFRRTIGQVVSQQSLWDFHLTPTAASNCISNLKRGARFAWQWRCWLSSSGLWHCVVLWLPLFQQNVSPPSSVSTLKMEVIHSFQTFIITYKTTQCHCLQHR
jgi:hypothetical protein